MPHANRKRKGLNSVFSCIASGGAWSFCSSTSLPALIDVNYLIVILRQRSRGKFIRRETWQGDNSELERWRVGQEHEIKLPNSLPQA